MGCQICLFHPDPLNLDTEAKWPICAYTLEVLMASWGAWLGVGGATFRIRWASELKHQEVKSVR